MSKWSVDICQGFPEVDLDRCAVGFRLTDEQQDLDEDTDVSDEIADDGDAIVGQQSMIDVDGDDGVAGNVEDHSDIVDEDDESWNFHDDDLFV